MFNQLRLALSAPNTLTVTLAAAGILMVTMGTRQSLGLFIAPINTASDVGIVGISLALFVVVYLLVFGAGTVYLLSLIAKGPAVDEGRLPVTGGPGQPRNAARPLSAATEAAPSGLAGS